MALITKNGGGTYGTIFQAFFRQTMPRYRSIIVIERYLEIMQLTG
jgi:hypothetical protein